MNRLIKITLLIYIGFASIKLAGDAYTGNIGIDVSLVVLAVGLISALVLLVTDVIQKDKKGKISFAIKPVDYLAISLWLVAILLALNESKINNSVHKIFELKRNLLVFEVVNGSIIIVFIASMGALIASMFMYSRSKRAYSLRLLVSMVCSALLILALNIPIEKVHVGSCGGKYIRLSLLSGGKSTVDAAKKQVEARDFERQKIRDANKGSRWNFSEGCSMGPRYALYLL